MTDVVLESERCCLSELILFKILLLVSLNLRCNAITSSVKFSTYKNTKIPNVNASRMCVGLLNNLSIEMLFMINGHTACIGIRRNTVLRPCFLLIRISKDDVWRMN